MRSDLGVDSGTLLSWPGLYLSAQSALPWQLSGWPGPRSRAFQQAGSRTRTFPAWPGRAGCPCSDPFNPPWKQEIKPASSFSRRGQATLRLFAKSKSFLKEPQKTSQCPCIPAGVGGAAAPPFPIPGTPPSSVGAWVGAPGPVTASSSQLTGTQATTITDRQGRLWVQKQVTKSCFLKLHSFFLIRKVIHIH